MRPAGTMTRWAVNPTTTNLDWRRMNMKSVTTLSAAVALLGALTLLASLAYAQDATGGNAAGRARGKRLPASAATDNSGTAGMGEDQANPAKAGREGRTGRDGGQRNTRPSEGDKPMQPRKDERVDDDAAPGEGAAARGASENLPPHRTEMVPMRDGVRLATDIYLPEGDGPWPAVLVRTPYNRKELNGGGAWRWRGFANNPGGGYAFVVQDWRGLFDSEGRVDKGAYAPSLQENDGYDTVEWVARQPWCNGKVGMTGGSGPGIAAKAALLAGPPHLVAVATDVAAGRPRHIGNSTAG